MAPRPFHRLAPPAPGNTTHSPIPEVQSSHLTYPVAHQPHPYRKTGLRIPPGQSQHHSQPHCLLECLRTRGAKDPPPGGDNGRLQRRHHQKHSEVCRAPAVLMLPVTRPGYLWLTVPASTITESGLGPTSRPALPRRHHICLPTTCSSAICSFYEQEASSEIKPYLLLSFCGTRTHQSLSHPHPHQTARTSQTHLPKPIIPGSRFRCPHSLDLFSHLRLGQLLGHQVDIG